MGSDMHMNPPKTHYRAKWEEDILIIEYMSESHDFGVWKELWRGNEEEVEKNRRLFPITPPLKPGSTDFFIAESIEMLRIWHDKGVKRAREVLNVYQPDSEEAQKASAKVMIQQYASAFPYNFHLDAIE